MNGASGTAVMAAAVTSFATFNGVAYVFGFDGANLRAGQGAVLAGNLGGSATALATLARDYLGSETEFVISMTKATAGETAEVIACTVTLS
jgi:hypothetical protein